MMNRAQSCKLCGYPIERLSRKQTTVAEKCNACMYKPKMCLPCVRCKTNKPIKGRKVCADCITPDDIAKSQPPNYSYRSHGGRRVTRGTSSHG